jgi:hypothetical protein
MDTKFCRRCGKPFESDKTDICPICFDVENTEFQSIKDFLKENPLATIFQVSSALSIPVSHIKEFLREERLEIVDVTNQKNNFLTCISCHKPISSGCYCTSCATKPLSGYYVGNINKSEKKASKEEQNKKDKKTKHENLDLIPLMYRIK